MKEKIYLIPGLMTDNRLWSRLIPLLEDEYELVHVPIPHSEDFDEIIDILFNFFKEEKINLLGFPNPNKNSSKTSSKILLIKIPP